MSFARFSASSGYAPFWLQVDRCLVAADQLLRPVALVAVIAAAVRYLAS